jgi:hypothetical protein
MRLSMAHTVQKWANTHGGPTTEINAVLAHYYIQASVVRHCRRNE